MNTPEGRESGHSAGLKPRGGGSLATSAAEIGKTLREKKDQEGNGARRPAGHRTNGLFERSEGPEVERTSQDSANVKRALAMGTWQRLLEEGKALKVGTLRVLGVCSDATDPEVLSGVNRREAEKV